MKGNDLSIVTNPGSSLMSRDELLSTFDGDFEFVKDIVGIFLERAPRLVDEMRTLLSSGEGVAAARTAHALKGMAGYFGRGAAYVAAATIEATAGSDLDAAKRTLEPLQRSIDDLTRHLLVGVLDV
jgi:two-component system, sensor histidine kinase and response regulator